MRKRIKKQKCHCHQLVYSTNIIQQSIILGLQKTLHKSVSELIIVDIYCPTTGKKLSREVRRKSTTSNIIIRSNANKLKNHK